VGAREIVLLHDRYLSSVTRDESHMTRGEPHMARDEPRMARDEPHMTRDYCRPEVSTLR
jgi:hypothetical protein